MKERWEASCSWKNYRLESMIGGQVQPVIPYPKISDEDWQSWKAFLPMKAVPFWKKMLFHREKTFLHIAYDIPPEVCRKMLQGASYFEEIEIWRKRQIRKDPIAVGIIGNGERYLICRWGVDKLIPFEKIKSRSWVYHIENFWGAALYFRKILAQYCGRNACRPDLHRNVTSATTGLGTVTTTA